MANIENLRMEESVTVNAPQNALYDMVSDITRMGEWSPVCKKCWWDDGASLSVGSWFTGKNVTDEREWETRSEVVVATRPLEFAWMVGGATEGYVRWGYRFESVADGQTRVTESWQVVKATERIAAMDESQATALMERSKTGMQETLANLKRAAELVTASVS